ncbi:hypothetical protein GGR58DRAFT_336108 [Xylaria digitata]|nr:hypothetical protein GGR58DRAFT_336108 [Xylaria digitata]
MENRPTVTHGHNYRPPHVGRVRIRHDISSGKEDAEDADEEEEWSDDSDSQESSNPLRRRAPPFNSHSYDGNLDELQNRMVGRVKTQPTIDYSPYAPNPEYDRYQSGDSARASRRHSNMSSSSPGGQTVPYGLSNTTANSFAPYSGQGYNPDPQYYYSPHTPHIPPPPQFYPSAYPEVESIRQELEAMKMENREKERRRIEKQRAEENRKKKRKAEIQQKRKAKREEEAQKIAFEVKMQQIKADVDKRLESLSEAARHRDPTADLYGILSNFLPPHSAASHYGHGYGYHAQDKHAHDMSMIMRKLDSLGAPEQQAPPARWFEGQGPPVRYHHDRLLMDDLRNQVDDLKWRLHDYEKIISALLPHQQRSAGQFADGGYHLPYGPGNPTSRPPYSLAASSSSNHPGPPEPSRLLRRPRVRVPRGRGSSPHTAVFSGVEEPTENEEIRRKNYNFRRYANDDDDDNDYSNGENLTSTVVADLVDESRQVVQNTSRKVRKKQPPSHEKPKASENNNATRAATYGNHSVAAQRTDADGEEYNVDSGHWSDTSDEEEYRHQSNIYVVKPDARFRREVFQAKDRHPQPFDQFTYGAEDNASRVLAPSPPLAADEDLEVRPRSNPSTY